MFLSSASCAMKNLGKMFLVCVSFLFVIFSSLVLTCEVLGHTSHGHDDDQHSLLGVLAFLLFAGTEVWVIKVYLWKRLTACCGIESQNIEPNATEGDDTQNAMYAPLNSSSMHGQELNSYPLDTGTVTTTVTTSSPALSREVRPVSQVTML